MSINDDILYKIDSEIGRDKEVVKLKKEIERLNNELEVAKANEETYRLEMLDITKRLGLDEETLFDDVKDKAERLNEELKQAKEIALNDHKYASEMEDKYITVNNIINELEKWLKDDNILIFDFTGSINKSEGTLISDEEVSKKIKDLKGSE